MQISNARPKSIARKRCTATARIHMQEKPAFAQRQLNGLRQPRQRPRDKQAQPVHAAEPNSGRHSVRRVQERYAAGRHAKPPGLDSAVAAPPAPTATATPREAMRAIAASKKKMDAMLGGTAPTSVTELWTSLKFQMASATVAKRVLLGRVL